MNRVAVVTVTLLLAFGLLLFMTPRAQAGKARGKAVRLTDRQLDAVTGGEGLVCGPASEACGRPKKGDPLTQIILWDEWVDRTGRPNYSPGGTWTTSGSRTEYRSSVTVVNGSIR